jgi:hypothetical protein
MPELAPIAPDVLSVERWVKLRGGLRFPVRMTVVRLGDGTLWVHSPVAVDDAIDRELAELGQVGHLIAPNHQHFLYAAAARARHPGARLWGAPGIASKRAGIAFDAELGADSPWPEEIEQVVIGGVPAMSEVVFFHRPSGTLIVTDVVFNLQETRGLAMSMLTWMTGTRRGLAQSRVWGVLLRERAAARDSLRRVLAWPSQRLVMAHGAPIEGPVREPLAAALRRFGSSTELLE